VESALDVPASAVRAEDQVVIAVGNVVERDGGKGLEESTAPL
jgi:hypothetical protein